MERSSGRPHAEQDRSSLWSVARGLALSFENGPLVMGIINVTPDSFSDGGDHFERSTAIAAGLKMIADGADIIDIGGESTRPGAEPVSATEEMERVVPVIEAIAQREPCAISVDTMKSEVAAEALRAGAAIVNDVTALQHDSRMGKVVREAGAGVILMHMRGEPRTMQQEIRFEDLLGEIASELSDRVDTALKVGIAPEAIVIDPGVGFGKSFDHNLEILARCGELRVIAPVAIGASRKAFIGHLTGEPAGASRVAGSLAAVAAAVRGGAAVVRVHDVRATVDFLKVLKAIEGASA